MSNLPTLEFDEAALYKENWEKLKAQDESLAEQGGGGKIIATDPNTKIPTPAELPAQEPAPAANADDPQAVPPPPQGQEPQPTAPVLPPAGAPEAGGAEPAPPTPEPERQPAPAATEQEPIIGGAPVPPAPEPERQPKPVDVQAVQRVAREEGRQEAQFEEIQRASYLGLYEAREESTEAYFQKVRELGSQFELPDSGVQKFFEDYGRLNPGVTPETPINTGNVARESHQRGWTEAEQRHQTELSTIGSRFGVDTAGMTYTQATEAIMAKERTRIESEAKESAQLNQAGERLVGATPVQLAQGAPGSGQSGPLDEEALMMRVWAEKEGAN